MGPVHVDGIQNVLHRERLQIFERHRIVPFVARHHKRLVGIDFPNGLRRGILEFQIVNLRIREILDGLVDDVVCEYRVFALERPREPLPHFDEMFGVLGLVKHHHIVVPVNASGRGVHFRHDFHAVLAREPREGFEFGDFAAYPPVVVGLVAVFARAPVIPADLPADEVGVPRSQIRYVLFVVLEARHEIHAPHLRRVRNGGRILRLEARGNFRNGLENLRSKGGGSARRGKNRGNFEEKNRRIHRIALINACGNVNISQKFSRKNDEKRIIGGRRGSGRDIQQMRPGIDRGV